MILEYFPLILFELAGLDSLAGAIVRVVSVRFRRPEQIGGWNIEILHVQLLGAHCPFACILI